MGYHSQTESDTCDDPKDRTYGPNMRRKPQTKKKVSKGAKKVQSSRCKRKLPEKVKSVVIPFRSKDKTAMESKGGKGKKSSNGKADRSCSAATELLESQYESAINITNGLQGIIDQYPKKNSSRKGPPLFEVCCLTQGEVVEHDAKRSYKAIESAPSPRKLDLVAGPLC